MRHRRGVSSVLAMMFLVLFGSLAAAMAVVAQGNFRTAGSSVRLSRAMSAAETGLVFAQRRLAQESARFVVDKGVIDDEFGHDLWLGTYSGSDGDVEILPPEGYETESTPDGIVYAVRDAHLVDSHSVVVEAGDSSLPTIDPETGTLLTRPIALSADGAHGPHFRLRYELVADEPMVRVTSTGVDHDISRTLQMDFRLDKKIEFAVISPNRIMIGKNVRVEGPLGSRYGLDDNELDTENGDPLVMRSDFYYLHDDLDAKLDAFFDAIIAYDVDGDNRLRPNHPVEGQGVADADALADHDGDEYVDDFDLFLGHYDGNDDAFVVYDPALSAEVGLGSMTVEFEDIDDQLARLIDEYLPDRNGDGEVTYADRQLGYRDGILSSHDLYAKVHGRLAFAVAEEPWEVANGGPYQEVVQGAVRPDVDDAPITFEVDENELREITTEMFNDAATYFSTAAQDAFDTQVQNQIGAGSGTFTPASNNTWEEVPYGAPSGGQYDWYQRPVYENFVFNNVRIPKGNNGLFINCTFRGVTYIETETNCGDPNWNFAGVVEPEDPEDPGSDVDLVYPANVAELDGDPVPDTRVHSNNIRFHNCTFLGSISGDKPEEYTQVRNKVQMTGTTRFYIDPDDPDLAEQDDAADLTSMLDAIPAEAMDQLERSSILMPGWSVDVGSFSNEQAADPDETPKIKLKGVIVAGILDVRGTADVFGTLLMTFRPALNEGPLYYGSMPDAFNTTIGYFGTEDGDGEGVGPGDDGFNGFGEITLRYNPDAKLPDGIPWPIRCDPEKGTYVEGGG